jgi:hypothetical protein
MSRKTNKKYEKDGYTIELFEDTSYSDWVLEMKDEKTRTVKYLSFAEKSEATDDLVESLRGYDYAVEVFSDAQIAPNSSNRFTTPSEQQSTQSDTPKGTTPTNDVLKKILDGGNMPFDVTQILGGGTDSSGRSREDSSVQLVKDMMKAMGVDFGMTDEDIREQLRETERRVKEEGLGSMLAEVQEQLKQMGGLEGMESMFGPMFNQNQQRNYNHPNEEKKKEENEPTEKLFTGEKYTLKLKKVNTSEWSVTIVDKLSFTKKTLTFPSEKIAVQCFDAASDDYETALALFGI